MHYHKLVKKSILFIFLFSIFLSLFPFSMSHAFTVGTTTTQYATILPYQRKCFHGKGYFYPWYSDGTNIVYQSSIDGTDFNDKVIVRSGTQGNTFSLWFDGDYIHYAYAPNTNGGNLTYGRGYVESNGTITSINEETAISGESGINYAEPFICLDSDNCPWIGFARYNGTYYYPYLTKSSNNNGTWSTEEGFPIQLSTTPYSMWYVTVLPLTSNKVYAIYSKSGESVKGKLWNGTGLETEEELIDNLSKPYGYTAVSINNDVHLAFCQKTTYDLIYQYRDGTTGLLSSEITIQENPVPVDPSPSLSKDSNKNQLYLFWSHIPDRSNILYYKVGLKTEWSPNPTKWIDERHQDEDLTDAHCLTSIYENQIGDSYLGAMYMIGSSSPYDISFAPLKTTTLTEEEEEPPSSSSPVQTEDGKEESLFTIPKVTIPTWGYLVIFGSLGVIAVSALVAKPSSKRQGMTGVKTTRKSELHKINRKPQRQLPKRNRKGRFI